MILQFIGFFVVGACGAIALWWACKELWYYVNYRCHNPLGKQDAIEVGVYIVAICVGGIALYYAGTHAPFEIVFDLKIK